MASSSNFYLLVVALAIILHTVNGADPLFHFCSSSKNFTVDSPYESNLNKLASNLYLQVPQQGFGFDSSGQDPDKIYGLGLCRGDVLWSDCKTCVVEACSEIWKRCPSNKAAIIWYYCCLFKYADNDFFGQIDNENKFYMWNIRVVNDSAEFNQKTKEFLSELANEAYVAPKLYETRDSKVGESNKLYGLVQRTRYLSSSNCKKCLDGIIGEFGSCCDGKEGGRVVSGSCNFRYEIYPFVNT